jgi:DNA-binding GntR family transcriptional regulator
MPVLTPLFNIKSLKEQVYDYLREQMRAGEILPGSEINLEETSRKLGVSRTPLRDALLQLETEGFVTIFPRRGIVVNPLTLEEIRKYYEIIGALESTALLLAFEKIGRDEISSMERQIEEMDHALGAGDFDSYYARNLEFHDVYLSRCGNENLVRIVQTLKKRLYDFPRRKGYVKEWEMSSIREHQELVCLVKQGNAAGASAFVRDVHWSFQVQEKFINEYYKRAPELATKGSL